MKLADDFLVKCLNYKTEYQKITNKDNVDSWYATGYYRRNYVFNEMCKSMFIVEEADFNIAIELCKEYKRSIQKKAYEHKLNQFKETGTYPNSGNPAEFVDDLRRELCGNRRGNTDKKMLVNEDLKKHFPEKEEIDAAVQLLQFVSGTNDVEKKFVEAQRNLEKHQAKLKSLHEATDAGNSVLEIVEQLKEKEED